LGVPILLSLSAAGAFVLATRDCCVESREPTAPQPAGPALMPGEEGLVAGHVIRGFVRSRVLDLERWRVRATLLRFEPVPSVHVVEIDSRGRFELAGLDDADYLVELVAEGDPPTILASVDYVRPGRDELMLDVDPLELVRIVREAAAKE
jgi:hypothetical protein